MEQNLYPHEVSHHSHLTIGAICSIKPKNLLQYLKSIRKLLSGYIFFTPQIILIIWMSLFYLFHQCLFEFWNISISIYPNLMKFLRDYLLHVFTSLQALKLKAIVEDGEVLDRKAGLLQEKFKSIAKTVISKFSKILKL